MLPTKEARTMKTVPLLALVALPENLPEHNLSRGQMGTVVEYLERDGETALLVEFSDEDGETIATLPLGQDQLIVLHKNSEAA
jgi:hypothetical protein